MTSGWVRSAGVALLVAAGYAAGSLIAWRLLDAEVTPVFFASAGITSAALVATRRQHWPWILVGIAVTEIALDLGHDVPVGATLGLAAANTIEPLVGALIVRRLVGVPDLSQRRDTAAFLASCVVAAPLVGGLVGATTLSLASGRSWPEAFLPFWFGDALGVLTVGSAVLAWCTATRLGERSLRQVVVVVALAALTAAATTTSFDSTRAPFVLPLAALFLAALAGGVTGVTTAGASMGLTANLISARGEGPWGDLAGVADVEWAGLQLFLALGVLGPWALAVEQAERRRTRGALDRRNEEQSRAEVLLPVTQELGAAATLDEVGHAVAGVGIRALAASGTVALVDERSGRLRTYGTGRDPGHIDPSARHPLAVAVRTGRPVIAPSLVDLSDGFPDLAPAYRSLGIRALLVVPIPGQATPIGGIALELREAGVGPPGLQEAAEALAAMAGQAAIRARTQERDRQVAHELQQALLPSVPAEPGGGVRVAVGYRPADPRHEVGGDWYDAFTLPDGRLGIAVGDIVGHDLGAATAMGKLQPALRVAAHEADEPGEVLRRLDQASVHLTGTMMATVGYADYSGDTRTLRYSCAGHPPPLLITEAESAFLGEARGLPLGLDPDAAREHAALVVPDPAIVVWYSDGLVETRGESLAQGLDRLRVSAGTSGASAEPEALTRRLLEQLGRGRPLQDDAVVVCVRF